MNQTRVRFIYDDGESCNSWPRCLDLGAGLNFVSVQQTNYFKSFHGASSSAWLAQFASGDLYVKFDKATKVVWQTCSKVFGKRAREFLANVPESP